MTTSFVYIWHDTKRNKFYIGSHRGTLDDGYVGSNKHLIMKYKSRPFTFKRRILEIHENITQKELLEREQSWLNLIKDSELHGEKYYNEKKVAAGGDIISTLTEEKKRLHKERSIAARLRGHSKWIEKQTKEHLSDRGRYARSKVKNPYDIRKESGSGSSNPFYGKTHSIETRQIMSENYKNRERTSADGTSYYINAREYIIHFPDGSQKTYQGQTAIINEFNTQYSIKFSRFIDTGKPVVSNRCGASVNKLIGCKIYKVAQ
jgi:hypothetical protein